MVSHLNYWFNTVFFPFFFGAGAYYSLSLLKLPSLTEQAGSGSHHQSGLDAQPISSLVVLRQLIYLEEFGTPATPTLLNVGMLS